MASGGSFWGKLFSLSQFILIIVIIYAFWQYGSSHRCIGCTELEGWGRVKPVLESISYTVNGTNPGFFEAVFVNTESFAIRVTDMSMKDNLTANSGECFIQTVNGVDESRTNKSTAWVDVLIEPRDAFRVTASCPTKRSGDSFDLLVNMTYKTNSAGGGTMHSGGGRIIGPVKYNQAPKTGE